MEFVDFQLYDMRVFLPAGTPPEHEFDLLIEVCDDDQFKITCTYFLPLTSPQVVPITTHVPTLIRKTNNLVDKLVFDGELDLLFNLLKCIQPLDPKRLFVPEITSRIAHLETTTKNQAMRRFEMAEEMELTPEARDLMLYFLQYICIVHLTKVLIHIESKCSKFHKKTAEMMTDMLGKSNKSLNDDLFTQQASLIDRIQHKSFNDSRNKLFDAIASLQLVV